MDPLLQEKIFNRFSNLYSERHLPATQTCMRWGLECGPGWFDLLWLMSEKLENLNFRSLKITQVKEKFGTLRVYYTITESNARAKIDEIIKEAELISAKTCSVCGKPGQKREKNSWSIIECTECYTKNLKESE